MWHVGWIYLGIRKNLSHFTPLSYFFCLLYVFHDWKNFYLNSPHSLHTLSLLSQPTLSLFEPNSQQILKPFLLFNNGIFIIICSTNSRIETSSTTKCYYNLTYWSWFFFIITATTWTSSSVRYCYIKFFFRRTCLYWRCIWCSWGYLEFSCRETGSTDRNLGRV